MEGSASLTLMFFGWWYGEARSRLLKYVGAAYIIATDLFSVKTCLRTLFVPWKRDVASYEGLTLQQRFEVWTLNLASRFIGAMIKTVTVITYLIFVAVITVFAVIAILVWLLYPGIIAYLIYLLVTKR